MGMHYLRILSEAFDIGDDIGTEETEAGIVRLRTTKAMQ